MLPKLLNLRNMLRLKLHCPAQDDWAYEMRKLFGLYSTTEQRLKLESGPIKGLGV